VIGGLLNGWISEHIIHDIDHDIEGEPRKTMRKEKSKMRGNDRFFRSSEEKKKGLTNRQQAVDETVLLLAVTPDAGHGLVVVGRVPVGIKHHEAIGTDQVQPTAASFAAKHEDPLGG
jgi:hypothetical protein